MRAVVDAARKRGGFRSNAEMAESLGISYDRLNAAIRGRSERAASEFIELARSRFNLPSSWPDTLRPIEAIEEVPVPVVGRAAAGYTTDQGDFDPVEVNVSREMAGPHTMAWIADGDSMMPHIRPGDVVVMEPADKLSYGKLMLLEQEGEFLVKAVVHIAGKTLLRSFNPTYEDFEVRGRVVGLVTGVYNREGPVRRAVASTVGLKMEDFPA